MHETSGDKAQTLTDTGDSATAAAEMPSVVPGKEPTGPLSPLLGLRRHSRASAGCKHTLSAGFAFHLFSSKQKSSLGFFWLAKAGTNIGLSSKQSAVM